MIRIFVASPLLPSVFDKKTFHWGTGKHFIYAIPPFPIVFNKKPPISRRGNMLFVPYPFFLSCLRKTFHCGTGKHFICTILLLPVVFAHKSPLIGESEYLYHHSFFPACLIKKPSTVGHYLGHTPFPIVFDKKTVHCGAGQHVSCTYHTPSFYRVWKKSSNA